MSVVILLYLFPGLSFIWAVCSRSQKKVSDFYKKKKKKKSKKLNAYSLSCFDDVRNRDELTHAATGFYIMATVVVSEAEKVYILHGIRVRCLKNRYTIVTLYN